MITIKPTSMIYKFHEQALVAERDRTPQNLCPYMRRFIRLFAATFIMFFVALFVAQGMLFMPLFMFSSMTIDSLGTGYLNMVFASGIVGWGAVAIGIVIFIIHRLFSRDYASRRAIDRVARKVYDSAADKVNCNVFYQWYKAMHDRICPQLDLPEKEEPAYREYY